MEITYLVHNDLRNLIPVFVWLRKCSIMPVSMETVGQYVFPGKPHFLRNITNSSWEMGKNVYIIRNITSNIIYKTWGHEIDVLFTIL